MWRNSSGKVLADALGKVLLCDDCPCDVGGSGSGTAWWLIGNITDDDQGGPGDTPVSTPCCATPPQSVVAAMKLGFPCSTFNIADFVGRRRLYWYNTPTITFDGSHYFPGWDIPDGVSVDYSNWFGHPKSGYVVKIKNPLISLVGLISCEPVALPIHDEVFSTPCPGSRVAGLYWLFNGWARYRIGSAAIGFFYVNQFVFSPGGHGCVQMDAFGNCSNTARVVVPPFHTCNPLFAELVIPQGIDIRLDENP